MKLFEEIIIHTPQRSEIFKNCIIVFLVYNCNHCDFIEFNSKSNEFSIFAHFSNIKTEINWFQI